tara:strand:- start:200 stop:1165 length:966 start_codon:yes stop_codon:yes gene_type:complete
VKSVASSNTWTTIKKTKKKIPFVAKTKKTTAPNNRQRFKSRKQKKTLYTKTTRKIHVDSSIVGRMLGSEKHTITRVTKSGKSIKTEYKHRMSTKVLKILPAISSCTLKFVDNKSETCFYLVIKGNFPTKAAGDALCEQAYGILADDIESKVKFVSKRSQKQAKRATAEQLYKSQNMQQVKHLDHIQSSVYGKKKNGEYNRKVYVTTFKRHPMQLGLFSCISDIVEKGEVEQVPANFAEAVKDTVAKTETIVNLPEPDELFVNVLIDVSNRVQLEKTNKTIVNIVNDNDEVMVLKEQLKSMTERMERAERINDLVREKYTLQ